MRFPDAETWMPEEITHLSKEPHVAIAMSGGVDSSVAALLVKRAGFKCSALFMKNWNEPTTTGRCNWENDVADALDVCERLDVPINTVDLSETYWNKVFKDFLEQYHNGRTPNPDVLCNREVKFKAFLEHAQSFGADMIATGHYVASDVQNGCRRLLKGADQNKDQSYFLYTLDQQQLNTSLFPLGMARKSDVRKLAQDAGLKTHDKKDSTGICFIGEQDFRKFLSEFLPSKPGIIRGLNGEILGEHQGAIYYTLGQRQGLGIGGKHGSKGLPWFVVEKNVASNELIVAQGHDHPALMASELTAINLSWIAGAEPSASFRCKAKIRHGQPEQNCMIHMMPNRTAKVRFTDPQRAVAPGQSVVFYDGRVVLGGGVIDSKTS